MCFVLFVICCARFARSLRVGVRLKGDVAGDDDDDDYIVKCYD